jgi:Sec-independent protein translocase protein TatA
MTVFGVGTLELVLILLLLILIFGPDRINDMGRWLGHAYRKLTGLSSEVNQQVMEVRRAMDSTMEASGLSGSIREAAAEVNSLQRDVNKSVSEGTAAVKDLQTEVEKTIGDSEIRTGIEQPELFEEPESAREETISEVENKDRGERLE